jgi:HEPN domain-containing protein
VTWSEGRRAIEFLLQKGRLERIDPGTSQQAKRRLETARLALEEGDAESAYSLAYTAYRMCAEGLLARQSLRSTGGEGGHRNVEEAVGAQFGNEVPAFAKPIFERFRGSRHTAEYFDPEEPDLTEADAGWALAKAEEAVTAAEQLLSAGRLDRFEE